MMRLGAVVLDTDDIEALADFYRALLGWPDYENDGEYIYLRDGTKNTRLIFQKDPEYQKPVWPAEPEKQQQMLHLDFYTADMQKEVRHAIACGAKLSGVQYSEYWTVMIDPAGHPFCIVGMND